MICSLSALICGVQTEPYHEKMLTTLLTTGRELRQLRSSDRDVGGDSSRHDAPWTAAVLTSADYY